jgi:hypothetical protein
VIVIAGVIVIVAFGSINSGLDDDTSVARLTRLWRRPGWLGFFFVVSFALILLYLFVSTLDAVLAARSDLSAAPLGARRRGPAPTSAFGRVKARWDAANGYFAERLEAWTAAKDDKLIASAGRAVAAGSRAARSSSPRLHVRLLPLPFSSQTRPRLRSVKLISGSLSHESGGN